ncbi:aspartate--tRNA(Asn) ligase [archaeon]|nr:aspartate--tRNA(Asn) ligase [archaeon]|tara:strand:- start:43 stop:1347 length:1305 start_codon:yes stop_codon:yes gene_type:complete
MERTYIKDAFEKKQVMIEGFIHEIRDQSKIKFILIRDRTGIIQCIVKPENKKVFNKIAKIPRESVLKITGEVKKSKQAPNGAEIIIKEYEILSEAKSPLPIPVNNIKNEEVSLPKKLDWRWIELRKPKNLLIFKIWTFMEKAMREYWDKENFIQIYTPKFMPAPSESGAELFTVPYFGKKAYLAQSPQFYKQMAMASGFEKIFEIGPVFRANPSHTVRHDTEFTMIDMEVSYVNSHEDVMKVEEEWINYFIKRIKEEYGKEIKEVFSVEINVPKIPFPRITMEEAQKLIRKKGYKGPKDDLDAEGEKMLSDEIKKKFNHEFIFVTEYPWSGRPFYHMKKEKTKDITKSFDLVWKGTEVTTGAQREHRHDILKEQAKDKKINLKLIKDYLNFFKYGCPPHGGFAISPTRFLMLLLGIKNVREVTFLPRDTSRLTP